jgi:hypothetical protein
VATTASEQPRGIRNRHLVAFDAAQNADSGGLGEWFGRRDRVHGRAAIIDPYHLDPLPRTVPAGIGCRLAVAVRAEEAEVLWSAIPELTIDVINLQSQWAFVPGAANAAFRAGARPSEFD